jgi:phosphoribosyl-ATP pyrophosphohydrolase
LESQKQPMAKKVTKTVKSGKVTKTVKSGKLTKTVKAPKSVKAAKPAPARRPRAARLSAVNVPPPRDAPDARVLDRLWGTVLTRKSANPVESHSARLLARGTAKIAQKFGEEAVECLIEAVGGHRTALIGESADVLYHLLVMWVDAGVRPEEVWAELARREAMSGIAEKAARPRLAGARTTKIP